MKYLVTPADWSMDTVVATSIAHDCAAAYVGLPPRWAMIGSGWNLAVIVETDETDQPVDVMHVDPS